MANSTPFSLYAGNSERGYTDKTFRSEHGSVDEARSAFDWLLRSERMTWAAVVVPEDENRVAWTWEADKPAESKPKARAKPVEIG